MMSDQIENLLEIMTSLPEIAFHIAAHTVISEELKNFHQFDNVDIYANFTERDNVNDLIQKCDLYLDINYGDEVEQLLSRFHTTGKLIFAFDNICHNRSLVDKIFSTEQLSLMITTIYKCSQN